MNHTGMAYVNNEILGSSSLVEYTKENQKYYVLLFENVLTLLYDSSGFSNAEIGGEGVKEVTAPTAHVLGRGVLVCTSVSPLCSLL